MKDSINISPKAKKIIAAILIIFTIILLPLIIFSFIFETDGLTENQRATLSSLEKIDNHPLSVMHYYGDYDFDEYLQVGERDLPSQNALEISMACTCFVTLNNQSDILFGRNLDWIQDHPTLILYTSPSDGYKSISIIDITVLESFIPVFQARSGIVFPNPLLYAPYFPLDGMNEHGLTIAGMLVPHAEYLTDPEKITLSELPYVRLALDHAKNIEEAFDLWDDYNIEFVGGPAHFLIADNEGNSAVVEWVENETKILRNEDNWHFAENFVIYGSSEAEKQSHFRYNTCESVLNENNGILNQTEAFNLLETVSQFTTLWSAVYNISQRSVQITMKRNYNNPAHEFFL